MAQSYINSDAVEIKTLKIFSDDGTKDYDLREFVAAFDVYEDIMYPVIRAEFTIVDSIDLITSFPINGEEIIELEFGTPGFDITCSYRLYVTSVDSQIINPAGKSKTYKIRAKSVEFMRNNTQYIIEKMTGNTGELIQQICNRYLKTDKLVSVGDPTKGDQDVLISRMRPFQAIDFLRKRAVSQSFLSSSYVFFENKRGFNFATIEFLLNQQQENVNDKIFFFDTTQNTDVKNMNTRSMITLTNVSQVDNTKKLALGSLNNIVRRFDLLTGGVETVNFKNIEQGGNFKTGSKNSAGLNTLNFEQKMGATPATSMLVPHSSELPENFINMAIGPKHSFVTKMGQNIYHAFVFGDTALTAGDVITVNVPTPTGDTGPRKDDRLYAGNYMISKLRHIVINSAGRQKTYNVSMELIKGFTEDYA